MNPLMLAINSQPPESIAVCDDSSTLTYEALIKQVEALAQSLTGQSVQSVVIYAENSIDWLLLDLACQKADILFTPIPLFFSDEQFAQVLSAVHADVIFSSVYLGLGKAIPFCTLQLKAERLDAATRPNVPKDTSKITFTSGSTGQPKGVCLSLSNQYTVAKSLVEVIAISKPKHLCLLPLPTLLENIAGIYAPLLAGGTVILASDKERGFSGSRVNNIEKLLECITFHQPNSLILVPELLQLLINACAKGFKAPSSLKFIAVGGAKVSNAQIQRARAFGLPVCQGYGLSECASVVSLSHLNDDSGSCGKCLPHLKLRQEKGELIVTGNAFLGYLNAPQSWGQSSVYTGDLVALRDNNLFIQGRIKNILVNSYGRNISPEWIESELLATGLFFQAVVIGDAKPFLSALLVPLDKAIKQNLLDSAIAQVNHSLPDYAQIQAIIYLKSPMTVAKGLYTENMRPKRDAIYTYYQSQIEQVYRQTCV